MISTTEKFLVKIFIQEKTRRRGRSFLKSMASLRWAERIGYWGYWTHLMGFKYPTTVHRAATPAAHRQHPPFFFSVRIRIDITVTTTPLCVHSWRRKPHQILTPRDLLTYLIAAKAGMWKETKVWNGKRKSNCPLTSWPSAPVLPVPWARPIIHRAVFLELSVDCRSEQWAVCRAELRVSWQEQWAGGACGRHRSPGNGLISFFPKARLPTPTNLTRLIPRRRVGNGNNFVWRECFVNQWQYNITFSFLKLVN